MASVTLKNLPPELHAELKLRAARNHRSLNQEVIHCLQAEARMPRGRQAELAAEHEAVLRLREKLAADGVWLTEEDLNRFKNEGRR